jgi:drug/metabolite transporter (DMT)-like permease
MNALALAIALSLLSAACYAAAAVAQERIAGHEARASWPTALDVRTTLLLAAATAAAIAALTAIPAASRASVAAGLGARHRGIRPR